MDEATNKVGDGHGSENFYIQNSGSGSSTNATNEPSGNRGNWSNGTLNLDGGLYIESDGIFGAPRGNVKISRNEGDGNSNAFHQKNSTIGFKHNDGTAEFGIGYSNDYQHIMTSGGSEHTIFYNIKANDGWI